MKKKNARTKPATLANPKASAELRCSAWLGQFRFSHRFAKCRKDGTCQKMTEEKRASMLSFDREKYDRIWAFQKSAPEIYESGPLFCGKIAGICSSQHCRNVHWPNEKLCHGDQKPPVASGKDSQ